MLEKAVAAHSVLQNAEEGWTSAAVKELPALSIGRDELKTKTSGLFSALAEARHRPSPPHPCCCLTSSSSCLLAGARPGQRAGGGPAESGQTALGPQCHDRAVGGHQLPLQRPVGGVKGAALRVLRVQRGHRPERPLLRTLSRPARVLLAPPALPKKSPALLAPCMPCPSELARSLPPSIAQGGPRPAPAAGSGGSGHPASPKHVHGGAAGVHGRNDQLPPQRRRGCPLRPGLLASP